LPRSLSPSPSLREDELATAHRAQLATALAAQLEAALAAALQQAAHANAHAAAAEARAADADDAVGFSPTAAEVLLLRAEAQALRDDAARACAESSVSYAIERAASKAEVEGLKARLNDTGRHADAVRATLRSLYERDRLYLANILAM
jgi:hypothetical protein